MKQLTLSAAALALAGCTANSAPNSGPQSSPTAGRDCFNVSFVQGFSSVGKGTVRLDVGPSQKYDVDISGPQCDQFDWTQRLALESSTSSWICAGDEIGQGNVYFRDPATRRRLSCYIQSVRRVSEPVKG